MSEFILSGKIIMAEGSDANGNDFQEEIAYAEDVKEFIRLLKAEVLKMNTFHFDQIQKIIDKKEQGIIDLNLDVLYKIHNNGHQECIEIKAIIDKLAGSKLAEQLEVKDD